MFSSSNQLLIIFIKTAKNVFLKYCTKLFALYGLPFRIPSEIVENQLVSVQVHVKSTMSQWNSLRGKQIWQLSGTDLRARFREILEQSINHQITMEKKKRHETG